MTSRGSHGRLSIIVFLAASLLALGVARGSSAEDERYDGVRPGAENLPPGSIQAGEGRIITFPGFQMLEQGRSRVFIQTAVRMEPTVRRVEGGFELFLKDARIPLRTNRLPLETAHFETPLKRVTVRQEKKGVTVRLALREQLESIAPRIVEAKDGYFFILIELPALKR